MMLKHESNLGVDATFDHVVGRVPYSSQTLLHLGEREQRPVPDETVEGMPRAPETLVDVLFAAVLQGEFTQEPLPFGVK